ncbi:hypothetical protein [Streptomyces albipurpureus]|uniref:Secreted protein n=1 Tax=Streptomyces albipurpureus TaxID=2897419 RepID=A0ABT0USS6_9ACTN|nr:hypothetical protein [Streptomyces sp. CWNU-1]MCM2391608.1 hypothetical protein [Streptomyces sp. CWNU-1]
MRVRRLSLALIALVATGLLIGAAAQLAKMTHGGPPSSISAMNKAELVG